MTNADPTPAPQLSDNLDAVIGENIHRLMWAAQDKQAAISGKWGMSQAALSLKLRGKRPWFAAEIDSAARHYGVTRDALFTKLPGLDSNQEPIGSQPAQRFAVVSLDTRRASRAISDTSPAARARA